MPLLMLFLLLFGAGLPAAAKIREVDAPAAARIREADAPGENQRVLPIYMYHQILKQRTGTYIVSPERFEEDICELKRRGYEAVLPAEVIAFAQGKGGLPEKPVMITFDDGHYNDIFYGQEILTRHGFKALINVIGRYSENTLKSGDSNPAYSHVTWAQICDARNSGVFEFGNHTFDLHQSSPRRGVSRRMGENEQAYRQAILTDLDRLEACLTANCGFRTAVFAYPFGAYDDLTERILTEAGYRMLLTCCEQRNLITQNAPDSLYRLCRFNRSPLLSAAAFLDKVERAKLYEYSTV